VKTEPQTQGEDRVKTGPKDRVKTGTKDRVTLRLPLISGEYGPVSHQNPFE